MTRIQDYDISKLMTGTVLSTSRLTSPDSEVDIRELIIEIAEDDFSFETGQTIGVIAPVDPSFGEKSKLRLYSIAGVGDSSNTIRICVKRCFYIDFINGEQYQGTTSNFLCDLTKNDTISLAGPYGFPFNLPEDKTADLLMVGLGTGIAPFRALVRHIYETLGSWEGKVRLFYGAKTGFEMAYMNDEKDDFSSYYDEATFKAFEAISPRPHFNSPIALDQALKQNSEEIWSMIQQPNTHIFMAGMKSIHDLTDKAFIEIAGSKEKWSTSEKELKDSGRWQEIIY